MGNQSHVGISCGDQSHLCKAVGISCGDQSHLCSVAGISCGDQSHLCSAHVMSNDAVSDTYLVE